MSRDISVSNTTGCKAGVRFPLGAGTFLFSTASRPALGPTQPSTQWILGVKWQGREADYSHPSSAEVKKMMDLNHHSPIHLHGVMLN
jgi:hypothetical protein